MNKSYITYLRAERRSPKTIITYESSVNSMLDYVKKNDEDVTYLDLVDWKASISNQSSATIARKIAAVKNYFEFLFNADVISSNPAFKLKSVKVTHKEKEPITADEVHMMIDCAHGPKNRAIITTLAYCGFRISELVNLTYDQYINRVNDTIIITGKGNKEREVYLNSAVIEAIDTYISKKRKGTTPYLFESKNNTQIDEHNVNAMLKLVAREVGIENWESVSPHTMRHTFATELLNNGAGLDVVQELMGHSEISTTRIYAKTSNTRKKEAALNLCF